MVKGFAQKTVTCPVLGAWIYEVESTTTDVNGLRYDATGGQFIQNWKTPGLCLQARAILPDDSVVSATFKRK